MIGVRLRPQMGAIRESKIPLSKGLSIRRPWRMVRPIRQRISQLDGSSQLERVSKCLGRSNDFSNIFEVEKSRESFMQTVNRDRLSANSRVTLTAFVEGAYLPWTKEERRASTSKGHREIWINYLRNRVGELRLREFRTVDASRMLRAIAKERDLTKTTLQHIKSVLSTIFTFAKNDGAFDGANPVDGVLIPWDAREPGETHAYDLTQVLQILDRLPLIAKEVRVESEPLTNDEICQLMRTVERERKLEGKPPFSPGASARRKHLKKPRESIPATDQMVRCRPLR